MANNAILCSDNTFQSVDFSGQSIAIGSFITATDIVPADPLNDKFYCFEITGGNLTTGSTYTATTEIYSSCYECLVDNYTLVTLNPCDPAVIRFDPYFDISEFGIIPTIGQTYSLEIFNEGGRNEGTYRACFVVASIEQVSQSDYDSLSVEIFTINEIVHNNYSIENGCSECLNGFSAGTESQSCQICWDGSGYTASVVSVPHPKWTNQFGQTINILDAIVLGGQNGLNN